MGKMNDYEQYDALGLAERIRKKDISPEEACEEAIDRIEKFNPHLNAVVTKMYDQGRKTAKGPVPDGPFAGVPFLLKDLLAAYAGVPMKSGCRALENFIPAHDSELVLRFKKAGLVILGKTSTPEFGLKGDTEADLYGRCKNPWNTNHSPGGSSGGTAAAVAAGIVPMASAGDGGGSIRVPSACCGLFGLKPSRGRNPTGPDFGKIWQDAVQEHIISRSVRDSAAMLDATHGPDIGAPYIIKPPESPYLEECRKNPGKLKIAFNTKSSFDAPVHPEAVKSIQNTAKLLEDLGHHVEEDAPDVDYFKLAETYLTMYFGENEADIKNLEQVLGRKPKIGDVEDLTWTLGMIGKSVTAGEFVNAIRYWDQVGRTMGMFFNKYDLYLTPTIAGPAPKIGELDPRPAEAALIKIVNRMKLGGLIKASGLIPQIAKKTMEKMPFTFLANLTGLPAMSVPLFWTTDNMPLGSHFIAPSGDEATLFRLAGQLEQARPWFDKRPPLTGN